MLVIYNPHSGKGKGKKIADRFEKFLKDKAINARFEVSVPDGSVVHQPEPAEDVVIIGGDGTFNAVINGLDYQQNTIGFIPAGTGNDFVKMLNIGSTEIDYFECAALGKSRLIDVGQCNSQLFLNGVGIGFDGQIVAEMQKHKKWLSGHAAYYYEVLRILSTYRERDFQFHMDGVAENASLILMTIGNGSTFGGGFKLTPHADLADGLLDVCQIGKISALRRYLNIPKLQNGNHEVLKEVRMGQVKELVIEANPLLNAHIDGEFMGTPPFHLKVLPGYLTIRG
ncbi:MAG: diacylglycerol kinase family protein [Bacteroidota bacterium]